MQLTDEMREWLNARSEDVSRNGNALFVDFMQEFGLDNPIHNPTKAKLGAKMLIRVWDAERRGIPMDKSRKFPDGGRSGDGTDRRT